MSGKGNADANMGERKMEGESDSVRTLDCLRGRLLAERAASRNAKEEALFLGNKLMELESLLKQEAKSRNRAEKKLKSLMKKLESFNISYVSDESEFRGTSDISSFSSTSSTTPKFQQENHNTKISDQFKDQESKESVMSPKNSKKSEKNDSLNCLSSSASDDSFIAEDISISAFEIELKRQEYEMGRSEDASSPPLSEIFGRKRAQSDECSDKSSTKMDQKSDTWYDESVMRSSSEENDQDQDRDSQIDDSMALVLVETTRQKNRDRDSQIEDQDLNSQIDDSMALVLVETARQKNRAVDPEVLDETVKEVLGALRYAKVQLRISMERRRMNMIRVG